MANATRVATSCNIYTHTHLLCLTWISLDDCRWLIDAATVVMYVRQTMQLAACHYCPRSFFLPRNSSGKFGCWTTVPFFFFRRRQHNNTLFLCVFFPSLRPIAGVSGGGRVFFYAFCYIRLASCSRKLKPNVCFGYCCCCCCWETAGE